MFLVILELELDKFVVTFVLQEAIRFLTESITISLLSFLAIIDYSNGMALLSDFLCMSLVLSPIALFFHWWPFPSP